MLGVSYLMDSYGAKNKQTKIQGYNISKYTVNFYKAYT